MSSSRPLSTTSLDDRRTNRRSNLAFEETARTLVDNHVSQLDVHRRSVLLFYLLFGLLVGFFLGIAGAKGVMAGTIGTEPVEWNRMQPPTRLNASAPESLLLEADETVSEASESAATKYAGAVPFSALSLPKSLRLTPVRTDVGPIAHKAWYVTLIAGLLAATAALGVLFWRHLQNAYRPRRPVAVVWAPHGRVPFQIVDSLVARVLSRL